jgi:hypothetical protein
MQAEAARFAEEFNKLNPPKPVKFLKASIVLTSDGYVMRCDERARGG